MHNTSSTRCRISALVAFGMAPHQFLDPGRMEVVQGPVVTQNHLLLVAVRSQVGRTLNNQRRAVGEVETDDLAMRPRGGNAASGEGRQVFAERLEHLLVLSL